MPILQETFEIQHSPETVFDLIDEVEKTSAFSEIVKGVQKIGPDVYRYTISVAGIPLIWDARVTERLRPERISWVSLRGISLAGSFALSPVHAGTKVSFVMRYNIQNRLLALILRPFIAPVARKVAVEVIGNIKRRLDSLAT